MIAKTLLLLTLAGPFVPRAHALAPTCVRPDAVEALITKGRELLAQDKAAEALPLFEQADAQTLPRIYVDPE